jgi:hypothetical protein
MAEGYIADECLTFCSRFLKGIDKSSSTSMNTNLEEENYLFDSFGDTIGSVQDVRFDGKTLIQDVRFDGIQLDLYCDILTLCRVDDEGSLGVGRRRFRLHF